jgi:hypothetical protein
MSRRASNLVRLARLAAARIGTTLDRNGFPVFDDPKAANRLPKRCREDHSFWRVGRRLVGFNPAGSARYEVESRCVKCGARDTTIEVES